MGKFFDKRNGVTREKLSPKIHITKLDKPIGEMTQDERRAAAEKIAMGSLESILNKKKES